MSALVPLMRNADDEGASNRYYIAGRALFWTAPWVCVTCETVIASVHDSPTCPTCDLRDLFERTIESLREELHIDY